MITVAQMQAFERLCDNNGISTIRLMEHAGRGTAYQLIEMFGKVSYLFVCGQGKNAGDGFVAARYLLEKNIHAAVLFIGKEDRLPEESARNYSRLPASVFTDALDNHTIIVDCLLGTGIQGPIREPIRKTIIKINEAKKTVVSLDVPSGMDPDSGEINDIAVKADYVFCMHDVKQGIDMNKYKTVLIDLLHDTPHNSQRHSLTPTKN